MIQLREAVFGLEDQAITGPINLTVEPGEKILLDGPSGAGKTSLLRGILGFLPLIGGAYLYEGVATNKHTIWALRQVTSYITQELAVGSGPVHAWLRECLPAHTDIHEADLAKFHLSASILENSLADLSRGERQRLAMVAGRLRNPKLYLLDEVTSALNAELRRGVIRHFSEVEATVIVVSHDDDWRRESVFRQHKISVS